MSFQTAFDEKKDLHGIPGIFCSIIWALVRSGVLGVYVSEGAMEPHLLPCAFLVARLRRKLSATRCYVAIVAPASASNAWRTPRVLQVAAIGTI